MTSSAADVERQAIEIVREVKGSLRIPVAVKIAPLLTAFAHFAKQLDTAGADGLVLFTRFHRVDIDVEELEVIRSLPLSDSSELPLRLRGAAALAGRIKASIAITGGVHTGLDVIKATMAGAHATQMVSALLRHGPESPAHGPQRDRVVDAGARMEFARRDARQHEPRADPRSGGVRTREFPDGAEMRGLEEPHGRTSAVIGMESSCNNAVSGCDVPHGCGASRLAPPQRSRPVRRRPPREPLAAQAAPAHAQAGYAGSDTCVLCHSDKGDSLKGTPHAQAKNPRIAGGDPGLRELPRARAGARGRRREREHPEVRADQARRDRTRRA